MAPLAGLGIAGVLNAQVARSFGLAAYRRQFMLALVLSCILAVGVAGPITFIGLIVPHLARYLVGRHFRLMLPLAMALAWL